MDVAAWAAVTPLNINVMVNMKCIQGRRRRMASCYPKLLVRGSPVGSGSFSFQPWQELTVLASFVRETSNRFGRRL